MTVAIPGPRGGWKTQSQGKIGSTFYEKTRFRKASHPMPQRACLSPSMPLVQWASVSNHDHE